MSRKIIHIDMDAFFASVEQRDDPALRGRPVAVGGSSKGGVVAAASYEARRFGVHSAMPSSIAARKCPGLIFVKHRFEVYRQVSEQIKGIFRQYTDLVEPLSLDEAFLDVTENKVGCESAVKIAREIRTKILAETDLTASAGVSVNKFLAKVASDIHKPNGLTVILPEDVPVFLHDLPIKKFFGVGAKTAEKMQRMGIDKGGDLLPYSKIELAQRFGKFGIYLYHIARGIDDRPVKPHRIRKSISNERTYVPPLNGSPVVLATLDKQIEQLHRSCVTRGIKGRTVNLKLRYDDFTTLTRSHTLPLSTNATEDIAAASRDLLVDLDIDRPIRLLGIGLSNLDRKSQWIQLEMEFEED
jgi:DNA polymerase-4